MGPVPAGDVTTGLRQGAPGAAQSGAASNNVEILHGSPPSVTPHWNWDFSPAMVNNSLARAGAEAGVAAGAEAGAEKEPASPVSRGFGVVL